MLQVGGLVASTIVGLIVGAAFIWARPERAWDHLISGFLWVLIIATGTGIVRGVRERVGRGEWRRCIALGLGMTFPLTTAYLVAVWLVSLAAPETRTLADGTVVMGRPDMLAVAPLLYGMTLLLAVLLGPVYMLTSPFGVKYATSGTQEQVASPHPEG